MVTVRNSRIDLTFVAEQLDQAKSGSGDRIAFEGLAMRNMSAVLQTTLEFSKHTPDTERQRIINESIFVAGRAGKLTPKALVSAISHLENEYLQKPEETFALVTTISMRYHEALKTVRANGVTITFSSLLPKRFDRSPLAKIPGWPKEPDPKDYTFVRVSLRARSKYEAFDRGLTTLDFFRGLWNFSLNRLTISRWPTGGRPQPINDIRLGPYHTMHKARGPVENAVFWYQTLYEPLPAADVRRDWQRVLAEAVVIRRRLRHIPYREMLHEVFVRYARALDSVDFESCFLRLWSLLELLTNTAVGARYDQTIDRTLFTFRDRELSRLILEHLRGYRNATLHQGASSEQVEAFTWQLKNYVAELIRFQILWSGRFATMDEVGAFLDLPHDPEVLRNRIKEYKRALRYRGRGG